MKIEKLLIQDFRNLAYVALTPSSKFNVIYGDNGSGKTSVLEAVSYLGFGRSFRTSKYQNLINNSKQSFVISAKVRDDVLGSSDTIGVSRDRSRKSDLKISINSEKSCRLSDMVDKFCVQIIHPQGIELITGTPEFRRQYLDWGLYYSVPSYKNTWLSYKKVLSQRNALLKSRASTDEILIWDPMLVSLSEQINSLREKYLHDLLPQLQEKLSVFLPNFSFDFRLSKGWEKDSNLLSLLEYNLEKDRVLGYTFYGCHRADLKIKTDQVSAGDTLSRGQLKLLVCAMRLAQGLVLKHQINKNCIFLIDDLSSELDPKSRKLLLSDLFKCSNQVFLTNISKDIEFFQYESNFINIADAIQYPANP